MSRRTISGNVSAEFAERVTDIDDDYTPEEDNEIERRTDEIVAEKIVSRKWWDDTLEGISQVASESATQLARCMENLDNAVHELTRLVIDGKIHVDDVIAVTGLTSALSILQRQAKLDLRAEAREQAELEYAEGDDES